MSKYSAILNLFIWRSDGWLAGSCEFFKSVEAGVCGLVLDFIIYFDLFILTRLVGGSAGAGSIASFGGNFSLLLILCKAKLGAFINSVAFGSNFFIAFFLKTNPFDYTPKSFLKVTLNYSLATYKCEHIA